MPETPSERSALHASRFGSFLFPETPRRFPGRRQLKTVLRAVHVVCAAALLGAFLFRAPPAEQQLWLHATGVSGAIFLLFDVHETLAFILQIRGVVVMLKILLVCCLTWLTASAVWLLGGLVVVSVISSHASADIRYRMLYGGGRITASTSKG